MARRGREFEEAVWAFVRTLDLSAEVIFDHKVPDRDTGTLRQCDVWINAKFGGHWAISILVSCKDEGRKLDVGDIGTFCDEVRSTGANLGVIYSRAGFSKNALKKAKTNTISCCRLYQNEPPDIPSAIWFHSFACYPKMRLTLLDPTAPTPDMETWNDVFNLGFVDSSRTVVDEIVEIYHKYEHEAVEDSGKKGQFPKDWSIGIEFSNPFGGKLKFQVDCMWTKYRGRIEASLVNGSYCLSNDSFSGSQFSPG